MCVSGESLRPHADKFDKELFQFCYIDSTDCVQGMSRSFQIVVDPSLSISPVLMESLFASAIHHTDPANNDDFVEIEDEDGEIVIIKSRTAFLEDELKKLQSAAKVDHSSCHCIF